MIPRCPLDCVNAIFRLHVCWRKWTIAANCAGNSSSPWCDWPERGKPDWGRYSGAKLVDMDITCLTENAVDVVNVPQARDSLLTTKCIFGERGNTHTNKHSFFCSRRRHHHPSQPCGRHQGLVGILVSRLQSSICPASTSWIVVPERKTCLILAKKCFFTTCEKTRRR